MENTVAIELKGITKVFGEVVANKDVDLTVYKGEVLSILGENGSGKTTLMNMISGIYFPDKGKIFVNGKEVVIRSPKDAFDLKIGMIHQHFKLVDVFSAADNIILGERCPKFDLKEEKQRIISAHREENEAYANYDESEHPGVLAYTKKPKFHKPSETKLKIAALPFKKMAKHLKFNWCKR